MADGKMMMSMPVVMTVTEGGTTAAKTSGMDIPAGKSAVSFENLSPVDTIIDVVSSPPIDAQMLIPNAKKMFVLEPGSYKFNAGSPGGTYSTFGEFTLKAGQWAEVVIFGNTNQTNVHDSMMMEVAPAMTTTMEVAPAMTTTMEVAPVMTTTMEVAPVMTTTMEVAPVMTTTMEVAPVATETTTITTTTTTTTTN